MEICRHWHIIRTNILRSIFREGFASRQGSSNAAHAKLALGYFDGGVGAPPLEKQIPRARKKATGMTKLKKELGITKSK
jgi:hypothetical protein